MVEFEDVYPEDCIYIFGRNEKCYLILLRKRIRFSMLFYSIMQFSLFLQPAIPLLINLISVYNKLFDSFSKTVFEFIINYCRTVLGSDERF